MIIGPSQSLQFQASASFAAYAPAAMGFPPSYASGYEAFEASGAMNMMSLFSVLQSMSMLGGGFGDFLGGGYGVPQAGYGAPAPNYGTPGPQPYGYDAPLPVYQPPAPAPQPYGYDAPQPVYQPPAPVKAPEPPKKKGGYA